jgi:hypothetical protein
VLHFPSHKRAYYVTQSLLGVSLLLLLALGVVVSIYIIRFTIEDDIGVGKAQIVASLLNSAQIQVRIKPSTSLCMSCVAAGCTPNPCTVHCFLYSPV